MTRCGYSTRSSHVNRSTATHQREVVLALSIVLEDLLITVERQPSTRRLLGAVNATSTLYGPIG